MKYKRVHAIVNPTSSGGTTGKAWETIQKTLNSAIGSFTFHITTEAGDAAHQAAQAIQDRRDLLVVVGGDGTLSEVVNGLLQVKYGKEKDQPGNPTIDPDKARKNVRLPDLALINQGTGGDFSRTLGVPSDIQLAVDQIKNGTAKSIDAGWIEYTAPGGQREGRFFINIAGCGMAGEVAYEINNTSKGFGALSYYVAALKLLFSYSNQPVEVIWRTGNASESPQHSRHEIVSLAICNGQFFGGGMQIAPGAELADGLLDITLIEDWNALQKLRYSRHLYNGSILTVPGVRSFRCNEIRVRPTRPEQIVRVDSDGDYPGTIEIKASVLPGALRILI